MDPETIGKPKLCPLSFSIMPEQTSPIAGPGRTQLTPVWYNCCKERCEHWVAKTNVGIPMCSKTLTAIALDNISFILSEKKGKN